MKEESLRFISDTKTYVYGYDAMLRVKKLHPDAKLPIRSATGYDLFCLEDGEIAPRSKEVIRTGISVKLPLFNDSNNFVVYNNVVVYGSIRSRSEELGAKYNIETCAGVIDRDYNEEIRVILHNHSDNKFSFKKYERIARLVLEVHVLPEIYEEK